MMQWMAVNFPDNWVIICDTQYLGYFTVAVCPSSLRYCYWSLRSLSQTPGIALMGRSISVPTILTEKIHVFWKILKFENLVDGNLLQTTSRSLSSRTVLNCLIYCLKELSCRTFKFCFCTFLCNHIKLIQSEYNTWCDIKMLLLNANLWLS